MKEFIDKLISRLEEGIYSFDERLKYDVKTQKHLISQNNGIKYAITIVNELAEEYKGKKVNSDLISRSEVIKELNEIYLDNPWDSKEDILEKAIGRVEHIAPYTEGE